MAPAMGNAPNGTGDQLPPQRNRPAFPAPEETEDRRPGGKPLTDIKMINWRRMLRVVQDYRRGRVSLRPALERMETLMELSDVPDRKLVVAWYALLGPLVAAAQDPWADLDDVKVRLNPAALRLELFLLERLIPPAPSAANRGGR